MYSQICIIKFQLCCERGYVLQVDDMDAQQIPIKVSTHQH